MPTRFPQRRWSLEGQSITPSSPPSFPVSADTVVIPERRGPSETSEIVDALRTAASESKSLVGQEFALARQEVGAKVKAAGVGAGAFGAAAVVGLFGVAALTAGLILAVALFVPPWGAALIVGGAYLVVAGLLALVGREQIRTAMPFVPQATKQSLNDLSWKLKSAWARGQGRA